ncbi:MULTISPECIES: hypothetical protein [unclassified Marinimicrobium]|uniref:hypothetical protein n=1 Tax=unclassified Marinimicrobium TaxID=2632100 RepID=UPI000C680A5C|nr:MULTISPECIES: hypothetical protein [unclassified Marinimicrobium]MAN51201.1 hypothetical protein [Marinimicrobium sp.]
MKAIYIEKCKDSQLWYWELVGETVPYIRDIDEGYLSREPAGYTNIVRREDGRVIDVGSD